ncbi:MAG: GNAT family N-acetyltransferase, partial [Eubacteriales bacterium]|nr:GNAT family N-acetyltransferase [Eubacteriales bacterium]
NEYPGAGEVYALYILAGYQGCGLGERLFRMACETMRTEGYQNVIVNCLAGNPALGFYRRMGCVTINRWEDDSTGFSMAGDMLRLELG